MITRTEHYTVTNRALKDKVATIQEMEATGWSVRQILYVPARFSVDNAFVVVFERDS